MTDTTTERLTRSRAQAVAKMAADLERKAATAHDAGLTERAERLEAEARTARARLETDREVRRQEQSERWERERRAKEAQAKREREAEERRERARQFLGDLFSGGNPVEVGAVYALAEEKGIRSADLLHAAGAMELRTKGWLKSGTLSLPDRGKGVFWGPADDLGPMLDLGPPRPAA